MSLAVALASVFPEHETFPSECWVRWYIERGADGGAVGESVRISQSTDAQGLASRLRLEHDPNLAHQDGHHKGVQHALTECEAMAWALTAGFEGLRFNLGLEKAADLVGVGVCIEAKTLNNSLADQTAWDAAFTAAQASGSIPRRSSSGINDTSGLIHKMNSALSNAQGKWAKHQPSDRRVVFFCLAQTDLGTLHDELWEEIEEWVGKQNGGETLVVIDNHNWQSPRIIRRGRGTKTGDW